jgi:predicted transcriptional regulator
MDMAAQIKNNLISRIKDSTDLNFLKALQTIFDSSEQSLYQLSQEQESAIRIGREQIAQGNFTENTEVMQEMKTWLTKK